MHVCNLENDQLVFPQHYVDGGLTNIQPTQTPGKTLTISPFSGDMDICPQDDTSPLCDFVVNGHCFKPTLSNFFRAVTALYPRNWKVISSDQYF